MFSKEKIIKQETEMLNVLGWDLMCATPASFLSVYKLLGIIFSDDYIFKHNQMTSPSSKIIDHMINYVDFFADFVLQYSEFLKYDSSDVAAAIIACV